jgi:hypothetical protein
MAIKKVYICDQCGDEFNEKNLYVLGNAENSIELKQTASFIYIVRKVGSLNNESIYCCVGCLLKKLSAILCGQQK